MKFCPVVPEICRGQVHGAWKERRITKIRNGAKTISLQTLFGRLNYLLLEAINNEVGIDDSSIITCLKKKKKNTHYLAL